MLNQNGTSIPVLHPDQAQGALQKNREIRIKEVGDRKEYCEMPSSGYDMVIMFLYSHQLWSFPQDLHKIKAGKTPTWTGKPINGRHSFSKSYWQVIASGGREKSPLKEWLLIGVSCSSEWPPIQAHTGSITNCTFS